MSFTFIQSFFRFSGSYVHTFACLIASIHQSQRSAHVRQVSINHGPNGSSRADFDVPFVPGKTTVGQVLQDAASRLVAAGGVSGKTTAAGQVLQDTDAAVAASGKGGDEESGPPVLPNLTLSVAPSLVETVSDQYIGQDWIKNRVGQNGGSRELFPHFRYHVVPALVSSDDEEENSSDDSSDNSSAVDGGYELRMVSDRYSVVGEWPYNRYFHQKNLSAAAGRRAVYSSKLYEYHALEGLTATAWSKIDAISIPIDDKSALCINLTPAGEIRDVVKKEPEGGRVLDLDLPESPGGATFADLKTIGKSVHVL